MNKFRIFETIVFLIIFLCGCGEKTKSETISTEYGDNITIKVTEKSDMHESYVQYIISGEELSGGNLFYRRDITKLPNNLANDLKCIKKTDQINMYQIQDQLFYVYNKTIYFVPRKYDLKSYLSDSSYKDSSSENKAFIIALQSLVKTKKLSYFKMFAPILIYEKDEYTVNLIKDWASGTFTDEDIQINSDDGYSVSDLQQWAAEVLQTQNG